MLRATVHAAGVTDRDGIKRPLPAEGTEERPAIRGQCPRLAHLRLDGGDNGVGKGKDRGKRALGWSAELVRHPPKAWAARVRAGEEVDWSTILPPRASASSRAAGWWRAPSRGWTGTGG